MDNLLLAQANEFLSSQHILSALSNISALVYQEMDFINWAGFYFYTNDELILGPFQGKIACSNIKVGKGVCGVAFEKRMLLNVPNVHEFEGHIACDSASCSELVVPLIYQGNIFGVFDIDSDEYYRFGSADEETINQIADSVAKKIYENTKGA